jgi:tetratricopeptide (TPR) repeat protein
VAQRDELLAAVWARLHHAHGSGDLSALLEPPAVAEAERLTRLMGDADVEAWHALGWWHWSRCQTVPEGQAGVELGTAVTLFATCVAQGVPASVLPEHVLPYLFDAGPEPALGPGRPGTEAVVSTTARTGQHNQAVLPADRSGALAEMDEAVRAGRQAVRDTPPGHADHAKVLSHLGIALGTRFERAGAAADIHEAVTVGRQAVEAAPTDHPHRAKYLTCLSNSLRLRFGRFGSKADIDEAVTVSRQAVEAAPCDDPDRAMLLSNLGNALGTRFGRFGTEADLDEAVTVGRRAVQAASGDDPDRAMFLSNVGSSLQLRFVRSGVLADLDEAVTAGREAVRIAPVDHPHRALFFNVLGNSLRFRFDRSGALADLEEAIRAGQRAVEVAPPDHPDRAMFLDALASSLATRAGRTGAPGDLDAAITAGRHALEATPADHPDRVMFLNNLGNSLCARFERSGDLADLEEAIIAGRQAVEGAPADDPNRAICLTNLGNALQTRYTLYGALGDLDAAITVGHQAVDATRPDHPARATYLSNLGIALRTRYERSGDEADLDAAVQAQRAAAEMRSAAPSLRAGAGRAAGRLLARSDTALAARLLENAVRLLPQVAPRGLDRPDQQKLLGGLAGLAGDAAALVLADLSAPEDNRAARALGLLESGRALLLAQVMETRGDLSDLRALHPHLAKQFVELREVLDETPSRAVRPTRTGGGPSHRAVEERDMRDRRQVAAALEELLERIRGLEGFASFALPPTVEDLLEQAGPGPVVTFNVSEHRSDALLLTTRGVSAVSLPDLTPEAVITCILAFHRALADRSGRPADRAAAQKRVRDILAWLWDTAVGPVLDALGFEVTPLDDQWPRVWWAAGGLLSLLPLHAAGHHTMPDDPDYRTRTALDRVVSSYTPTITALRYARRQVGPPRAENRTLIVAMPTTPGLHRQGRLTAAAREAAQLLSRLPHPILLVEPESGSATTADQIPTRETVLAHLAEATVAHFACHGSSHLTDPSQSLLLLHDWQDDPLTVASLSPVSLEHARLAYLSACSTTLTRTPRLLDESIHLTAAFQLAGFPHVIGTLWEINDRYAADITDTFYTHLTDSKANIDTDRAAYALHSTIRALRDRLPITPSIWAAHLHAGA